jgi:hypothetical protein
MGLVSDALVLISQTNDPHDHDPQNVGMVRKLPRQPRIHPICAAARLGNSAHWCQADPELPTT